MYVMLIVSVDDVIVTTVQREFPSWELAREQAKQLLSQVAAEHAPESREAIVTVSLHDLNRDHLATFERWPDVDGPEAIHEAIGSATNGSLLRRH